MFEDEDKSWYEAMKSKGHMPITIEQEDGDTGDPKLDPFHLAFGHCNGPGCAVCGWSCCMYCESIESIPVCGVIEGEIVAQYRMIK